MMVARPAAILDVWRMVACHIHIIERKPQNCLADVDHDALHMGNGIDHSCLEHGLEELAELLPG